MGRAPLNKGRSLCSAGAAAQQRPELMLRRHWWAGGAGRRVESAQQRPELMLRRHSLVSGTCATATLRSTKAGAYAPATPWLRRRKTRWRSPLNKGRSLCSGDTIISGSWSVGAWPAQQRPELMLRRHQHPSCWKKGGTSAQQKAGAYAPATRPRRKSCSRRQPDAQQRPELMLRRHPSLSDWSNWSAPTLNKGRSLCSGDTSGAVPVAFTGPSAQQRPELMLRRHAGGARHGPPDARPLNKGRSLCSGDTAGCLGASG